MSLYKLPSAAILLLALAPSLLIPDESAPRKRELEIKKDKITIKEGETTAEVGAGEVTITTDGTQVELKGDRLEIQTSETRISLKDATSNTPSEISIDTPNYRLSLSSDSVKIIPTDSHANSVTSEPVSQPARAPDAKKQKAQTKPAASLSVREEPKAIVETLKEKSGAEAEPHSILASAGDSIPTVSQPAPQDEKKLEKKNLDSSADFFSAAPLAIESPESIAASSSPMILFENGEIRHHDPESVEPASEPAVAAEPKPESKKENPAPMSAVAVQPVPEIAKSPTKQDEEAPMVFASQQSEPKTEERVDPTNLPELRSVASISIDPPESIASCAPTASRNENEDALYMDPDIVDFELFEDLPLSEPVAAAKQAPEQKALTGPEYVLEDIFAPTPVAAAKQAPEPKKHPNPEPVSKTPLATEPSEDQKIKAPFFLSAEELSSISRETSPEIAIGQIAEEKSINVPSKIKGIYVIRGSKIGNSASAKSAGVHFDPTLFTKTEAESLCLKLTPYLGQSLKQGDLDKIRTLVFDAFPPSDTPLTNVMIPPQDISSGILQVVVYQSKVGEVSVRGNDWYPTKEILKSSELKTGDALYLKKLEKNLAVYNRNPFIRVDAVLRPGAQVETTDVDLVVMDRFPFRPYVGGDNTGVTFTDKPRFYAGFTAGRLFTTNQQFSYQFTTTDQPEEFAAHSANYTIPLPWQAQSFMVYGGWARVRGTMPTPGMKNKGTAWQISGRYSIPISPFYGTMIEELYFGYDFKRTNNSYLFGGDTVSTQGADINQFVLGCVLDFHSRISKTSLVMEVFGSPWRLTGAQSAARYSQLRFDAKPLYAYGKFRLSHTRDIIHGFQFKGLLAGQGTGWNLLPSEEFGLGGYATVRGYEERALNTDSGINASVEILTPRLRLFSLRKKENDKEELRFLAFADYGMGIYSVAAPDQKKMEWLLGMGGGVRYNYSTNIVLRCDVGAPLHKAGLGRHGMHVHTGGTLSY